MNALDDTPVARDDDDVLLTQIDRALAGMDKPDSPGMDGFAARLATSAPQAPDSFQDALHQRLLNTLEARPHAPLWTAVARFLPARHGLRAAIVTGGVALGLVAGWSLSPVSGGWAQQNVGQLMHQLGFSTGPVSLEKPKVQEYRDNLTLEGATAMLGFRPAVPTYLPGGYPAPDRFSVYALANGLPYSVWWRTLKDNGPWWGANRISLVQDPVGVDAQSGKVDNVGSTPAIKVRVQGVDGLWLQMPDQVNTDSNGNRVVTRYKNVLRWEKAGFRYTLSVPADTDRSVALRIADSLR